MRAVTFAFCIVSGLVCTSIAQAEELHPKPSLSPQQVVETVLNALANNDQPFPDAGIETTFRFAAPSNKQVTGPIERFKILVKNDTYRDLIGHERYEIAKSVVGEFSAYVPVSLWTEDGRNVGFMFRLGKQSQEPYEGVWMTEAVFPIDIKKAKIPGVSA
ncbi:MAG: hypothetical protein AAF434_04430 [Pseudomonadota bacterium]